MKKLKLFLFRYLVNDALTGDCAYQEIKQMHTVIREELNKRLYEDNVFTLNELTESSLKEVNETFIPHLQLLTTRE